MSLQKYIDTEVARLVEATGAAAQKLKFQALPAKKSEKGCSNTQAITRSTRNA